MAMTRINWQKITGQKRFFLKNPKTILTVVVLTGVVLKKINIKKQQQKHQQQQQQHPINNNQLQQQQAVPVAQWAGQAWVRIPPSNYLTVPQPNFLHPALFDPGCAYMVNFWSPCSVT